MPMVDENDFYDSHCFSQFNQVMESREEVETSEDPSRLKAILRENKEKQIGVIARLNHAFESQNGSRYVLA